MEVMAGVGYKGALGITPIGAWRKQVWAGGKPGCDAVTAKTSADPARGSGAGRVPVSQRHAGLRQRQPFLPPVPGCSQGRGPANLPQRHARSSQQLGRGTRVLQGGSVDRVPPRKPPEAVPRDQRGEAGAGP